MKPAILLSTVLGNATFNSYMAGVIAPELWLSMRATSGATETNRGTTGSALNAAIAGGVTLGLNGAQGIPNETHDVNGTTGLYTVTNHVDIQGSQFWYGFLVNPDTAGELSAGRLANHSTQQIVRFNGALTSLRADVVASGASAFQTTSTGLTAGQWAWVFVAYDNTGSASFWGTRSVHIYKGQAGVVTEYAYSGGGNASGTYTAPSASLILFNNAGASVTFDGKVDEVFRKNSLPATLADLLAQMTNIVRLTLPN